MNRENRNWMYNKYVDNGRGLTNEFKNGVIEFVKWAQQQTQYMDGNKIRCPCKECKNNKFLLGEDVCWDLYTHGFIENYYNWTSQGEPIETCYLPQPVGTSYYVPDEMAAWGNYADMEWEQRMVYDLVGSSAFSNNHPDTYPNNDFTAHSNAGEGPSSYFYDVDALGTRFQDVLKSADQPLYSDCDGHSQLSAVSEFLNIKSEYNLSENCMSRILDSVGSMLPRDHSLPDTYYNMKKFVSELGLPMIKIHACPGGCMLFWKNDEGLTRCKFCNEDRYKPMSAMSHKPRKRSAASKLIYLPLAPRLQRLYASSATAKYMTWHVEHDTEEGLMCHPSDSDAWKHLDRCYPEFAFEPRNVRLGLCADGFAPYGQFGGQFSCWPIIITPYNLPPDMCMKQHFMFLSLMCPGPGNPKKRIDVYLQPLIEELKQLWDVGVPTYDVTTEQIFNLRAVVLWTISDFPAYGMLSGWSTAGLMGCPVCMEKSNAFWLKNSRKPSYFDCHRRFLPQNHPYRKDKKSFLKGRVERDPPPPRLTGYQILNRVQHIPSAIDEPLEYPYGYKTDHKWTKKSIFWELPYWKYLLIRHNLDVMHIEKNVFDNIFNTVMNFKGRTKDGLSSRRDIALYCDRPEIAMGPEYEGPYKKVVYQVTVEQKQKILEWLIQLRFPDGYTSNFKRIVDLEKLSIKNMKSHDCHVIMQRLLSVALKENLPANVWACIVDVSQLFQLICSPVLNKKALEDLHRNVPTIMCNLEKVFPPSFFDGMEHLLIHLPWEARRGGPPFYRWMYSFERFLRELKKKVTNKAHVGASICQAYLTEEVSTFSSFYFERDVITRRKRPARNDDIDEGMYEQMVSIFNYPGKGYGRQTHRHVVGDEFRIAHTYILVNCPEVIPYYNDFRENLSSSGYGNEDIDHFIDTDFARWFKQTILREAATGTMDPFLESLAWGPETLVKCWSVYFVNGYKYHTRAYGNNKPTMNSGVCVPTCSFDNSETDFFGYVDEILEMKFAGEKELSIVLFRCTWVDPVMGVRKDDIHNLRDVNHARAYQKNEPFILAQQAAQVYYAEYPTTKQRISPWVCACTIRPRKVVSHAIHKNVDIDIYQQEFFLAPVPQTIDEEIILEDFTGAEIEPDPNDGNDDPNEGSQYEEDWNFQTEDTDEDDYIDNTDPDTEDEDE
ncbi:unnamed protein product [Cuscuta epithymum]|nr:unnamed protein product [Cuscuta epithymum]